MRWLIGVAFATALVPQAASAKALSSHLGIGFTTSANGPAALSVRFVLPDGSPASNIAIEVRGGIESDVDDTTVDQTLVGVRGLYGFVAEDHLNVYASAAVDILLDGTTSTPRVSPGLSIESFPFGFEYLGFSAELGLAVEFDENRKMQTFGHPAAGVTYYF